MSATYPPKVQEVLDAARRSVNIPVGAIESCPSCVKLAADRVGGFSFTLTRLRLIHEMHHGADDPRRSTPTAEGPTPEVPNA